MILSSGGNVDPTGAQQTALQLYRDRPEAGRWSFVMLEAQASGNQTSMGFNARITLDGAQVAAAALPDDDGTVLSASQPPITIPLTADQHRPGRQGVLRGRPPARVRRRDPAAEPLLRVDHAPRLLLVHLGPSPRRHRPVRRTGERAHHHGRVQPSWVAPTSGRSPSARGSVGASLSAPEVPYGPWYMSIRRAGGLFGP